MAIESLKNLERRIRHFVRGSRYRKCDLPADEKFYWHVSHLFQSVLGDGSVAVTMTPDQSNSVQISQDGCDFRLQLTSDDHTGQTILEQFENGCWVGIGRFSDRQGAILRGLKIAVAIGGQHGESGRQSFSSGSTNWIPMIDGRRVPAMLNMGD